MEKFIKNFKWDALCIGLLFLTSPLFFYKLGQSSLGSFDEAWYGDIARTVAQTGQIFNLSWNGYPYLDHPPAGFWIEALSFKLFGVSEFTARLPQALLGLLSLLVIYLLGMQLFNRWVGLSSGLALASSIWFLYRARSGNLDITLTFFFLLTLLLALKAVENKKYLIPLSIIFSFLILTKTLVPLTIIPSLVIILWKTKYKVRDLIWPGIIFVGLFGGWLVTQIINYPDFLEHYFQIGLPGVKTKTNYLENLKLMKEYLHSGVGKWFWPGLLGIFVGLFLKQKRLQILSAFFLTFFLPFLFSPKGHIWHLIPLHPFMILSFLGLVWVIGERWVKNKKVLGGLLLVISLIISFNQIRVSWYQFIDIPAFISDEAILSTEAGKYSQDFYIDGDFGPAAVFYSKKITHQVVIDQIKPMFESSKSFVMITKKEQLDNNGVNPQSYKIIKSDRDKILVLKL